jgi:DNA-binding PadR family transcriptional regulator
MSMPRFRKPSPQTRAVLGALLEAAPSWQYGYELSGQTALMSGTLYPLLIRLERQGLLESEWRESDQPGRPPRHVYRLTSTGAAFAREYAIEPKAPLLKLATSR